MTLDLPFNEIVFWGKLHLFKMCTELRHGLMKEDSEGIKVGSHQRVVHSKESQVGGAVEEVGQTDKGIGCLHVEQEDSCQEGHTLDVTNVGTVAGVGS